MGETSVYYVPRDEQRWIGHELEAAKQFWQAGIFVITPDNWAYEERARYRREARALPGWAYTFTFASMGFGGLGNWDPVPNAVYEQACPSCSGPIGDAMTELWNDESETPLPARSLVCPHCAAPVAAGAGIAPEPFVFSRFYLWVSDIDEVDWQPEFRNAVERVLGPCSVYQAWET